MDLAKSSYKSQFGELCLLSRLQENTANNHNSVEDINDIINPVLTSTRSMLGISDSVKVIAVERLTSY